MKKIMNRHENVVNEMCNGLVLAHPELELDARYRIIRKKELNNSKVTLLSGGGSGHEPAHAGLIGSGMLDGAVCGDVFASPSQIQVYQAIRQTASRAGTLLIIKNYSGDIMNFKNAAYLASEDGMEVDYVKVDDDIAVQDSLYTVGRRGVAGTIFIHKLAGAAAEQGKPLAEVKRVAEKAIANVRSIGFALSSCTVPAKGSPTFRLGDDEMEYGVGIHGEPGIRRENRIGAQELAARMVLSLCGELGIKKDEGGRVALLINGFGATPLMELYLLNFEVTRELALRHIQVVRTLVGNYMTSIDMAGASVSLLKLDDELEQLLNVPCDTPAFKMTGPVEAIAFKNYYAGSAVTHHMNDAVEAADEHAMTGDGMTLRNMQFIVAVMRESIIKNEQPFCDLDSFAGDGDFGMSVAKGFRQLKREWQDIVTRPDLDIGGFLNACALVIMEHCGGASGPVWGSAFRAAGRSTAGKKVLTVCDFAAMLKAAVEGIQAIGEHSFGRGAVVGDKTLIDALIPCAETWNVEAQGGSGFLKCFVKGAEAAVIGARKTEQIVARMGRAGTVGERSLGHPDAGAYALGVIFTDISNALK